MKRVQRIKRLILERNMTQEAIAKELEISRSTLTAYEQNRINPPADMLKKLSNIYDVSIIRIKNS